MTPPLQQAQKGLIPMDTQSDQMDELTKEQFSDDDKLAMLELHGMIHNARTIGAFLIGISIGVAVAASSISVLGYGPGIFYVAAGVFTTFGVLASYIGPRAVMAMVGSDSR